MLKANPFLHGITLPGAITPGSYSAFVDDVAAFVKSKAEIDEIGKQISSYER